MGVGFFPFRHYKNLHSKEVRIPTTIIMTEAKIIHNLLNKNHPICGILPFCTFQYCKPIAPRQLREQERVKTIFY